MAWEHERGVPGKGAVWGNARGPVGSAMAARPRPRGEESLIARMYTPGCMYNNHSMQRGTHAGNTSDEALRSAARTLWQSLAGTAAARRAADANVGREPGRMRGLGGDQRSAPRGALARIGRLNYRSCARDRSRHRWGRWPVIGAIGVPSPSHRRRASPSADAIARRSHSQIPLGRRASGLDYHITTQTRSGTSGGVCTRQGRIIQDGTRGSRL